MFSTANLLVGLGTLLGFVKPRTHKERLKEIGYPLTQAGRILGYPYILDASKAFLDSAQYETDYVKPGTLRDRLLAIGYPMDEIPDEFCDSINQEIMENPMKLDDDRDHDHYVDQAWLLEYWRVYNERRTQDKQRKSESVLADFIKINPFTNNPIRLEPVVDHALKQRIEEFVASQERLAIDAARRIERFVTAQEQLAANTARQIEEIKCLVHYHTSPYSNLDRLRAIKISMEHIPTQYIDVTGNIMTYPVVLDGNPSHVIDLRALLSWWHQWPENKNKNPFTENLLEKAELDTRLLHEIETLVAQHEKAAYQPSEENDITVQVTLIELLIREQGGHAQSCHERLAARQFRYERMPEWIKEEFIAQNFVAEIMTHPVKLDNHHVVDFNELLAWWKADPDNMHKNFYTGQKLKSIEYMRPLKNRIERFVMNPEEYMHVQRTAHFISLERDRPGIYTRAMFLRNARLTWLASAAAMADNSAAVDIASAADESTPRKMEMHY